MLSRIATEFAAEIRDHDWSDAPYRIDRAGHRREHDGRHKSEDVLDDGKTDRLRINVVWVTAQVLMHADPNLDLAEFALACGVDRDFIYKSGRRVNGWLTNGIRVDMEGRVTPPGNEDLDK